MFSHLNVFDVTPTLDTGIYADGDVLFNPTEIPNVFMGAVETALFISFQFLDEDDQGGAFDLYLLNANNPLGTINAAPNITDALARSIIVSPIRVSAGDYYDLTANRAGGIEFQPRLIHAAAGSTSLWLAGISRDAKTYTANGLKFKLGFGY